MVNSLKPLSQRQALVKIHVPSVSLINRIQSKSSALRCHNYRCHPKALRMQTSCGFRNFCTVLAQMRGNRMPELYQQNRRLYHNYRGVRQLNSVAFLCRGLRVDSGAPKDTDHGFPGVRPKNQGASDRHPVKRDTSPTPRSLWRLANPLERRTGYLRGRTESFIALPTRNLSVVFAGI